MLINSIPLYAQVPKAEQLKISKKEMAQKIANYLIENDLIKVKYSGCENPEFIDIYEAEFTFVNEVTENE